MGEDGDEYEEEEEDIHFRYCVQSLVLEASRSLVALVNHAYDMA